MLRIAKLTDYGVQVMVYLSRHQGEQVPAARIARDLHFGPATVGKVMKLLLAGALIRSERGVQGGYRLAHPPEEIRLGQIIEALEGPLGVTECALEDGTCERDAECSQKSSWRRINRRLIDYLHSVSLADLCGEIHDERSKAFPLYFR